MKLSLNWLESYFEKKPDWDIIWSKLTMAGIEVEGIEHVAPPFSGIVVAEVVDCIKHPDADKLNLCKVDAGTGEVLQIICGAANVTTGVKVPCAKVGAVLPDGLNIAERKMRGLTSFGMLCSGNEIACPDGVDGLLLLPPDAVIGTDIRDYLGLDDQIVEFKITPNRGDCLSVQGLLREIAALTEYKIKPVFVANSIEPQIQEKAQIIMDAGKHCPNYLGLIIKGVNNQVALPDFITKRLSRSGVRSVSPLVDIANYVMFELGQPLHAFDLANVGTQIQVRMAKNGETLKLLDGKDAVLQDNTLVICDSKNRPAAIAGVMGGFDSGITDKTVDMLLESAYFTTNIIAGKAKQYGVSSDAAYRYERGVDPTLQTMAITYAALLIQKYCHGTVGIVNQVQDSDVTSKEPITLRYQAINRLIGCEISIEQTNSLLKGLGFVLESSADKITVTPPSYRFDIAIKEDVIEEVARVYGYDNIEPIMPIVSASLDKIEDTQTADQRLKQVLVNLGYNEIVGYAFIEEKYELLLGKPETKPIKLQNPIAGLNVMRTSLIADLIKAYVSNLNRGYKHIRLFELSRVFYGEDFTNQPLKLAGLISGNAVYPSAENPKREVDFFDLKHAVELILNGQNDVGFVSCNDYPVFHLGRCAKIYLSDTVIGIMGQLHPKIGQELGLTELPYLFELDMSFTSQVSAVPKIQPVSKFQKVERDLAFVLSDKIMVGDVVNEIKKSQPAYLMDAAVFDVYQGTNVSLGSKSVAINFTFQSDKTLGDEDINSSIDSITNLVQTKFDGVLRK